MPRPEASWPSQYGVMPAQLDLPLQEPAQPECRPGMKVRVIRAYRRQPWPGAPVDTVTQTWDGVLMEILPAGEWPTPKYFKPKQRPSKYDRWVLALEKYNSRTYARRDGSQKIEIIVLDKGTKAFRWDLAE